MWDSTKPEGYLLKFLRPQKNSSFQENRRFASEKVGGETGFGIVMTIVFCVLGWFFESARLPLLGIAGTLALVTWLAPHILRPANVAWAWFGIYLGRVVSPLIMVVVFIIAVIPTGLVMRLLGKNLLRLHKEPRLKTYWVDSSATKSSLHNQF